MANESSTFTNVGVSVTARSRFDMSNTHNSSCQFGQLTPIYVQEMNPNDSISVKPQTFIQQVENLSCPTFANITAHIKAFFVPYRVLWGSFDQFYTQATEDNLVPPLAKLGEIAKYMYLERGTSSSPAPFHRGTFSHLISNLGLGSIISNGLAHPLSSTTPQSNLSLDELAEMMEDPNSIYNKPINLFPFRAYQRIWWDYYRDSSLVDEMLRVNYISKLSNSDGYTCKMISKTSDNTYIASRVITPHTGNPVPGYGTTDSSLDMDVLTRYACYDKNYFTTARTSPQLGSSPSVVNINTELVGTTPHTVKGDILGLPHMVEDGNVVGKVTQSATTQAGINAELQQTFSVEDWRNAIALQKYLETKNIAGSRYIQQLFAMFGTKPTAERLDMAEFIGATDFNIDLTTAVSTDGANTGSKSGSMSAFGQANFDYHSEEHGIFMILLDIMPQAGFCTGIDPFFTKRIHATDYFQPDFEMTGFQPIYKHELFAHDYSDDVMFDSDELNEVFGYTARYADMKWHRNVIASDFLRPSTREALKPYIADHIYLDVPELNMDFLECKQGINELTFNRIFSIQDDYIDHFLVNVYNDCNMERPMQSLGAPAVDFKDDRGHSLTIPFGGIRVN